MTKLMKFFYALLIGVMSVSFAACGDDDDDQPANPADSKNIVGTWKGYNELQKPSDDPMTARFYEDGTCEIWWYQNPLITTYYFRGEYTVSKGKLHLKGKYGDNGDTPHIEYDKTVGYSVKDNTLKFKFHNTNWTLTKK
ncbi:MAG: hypothetical protein J6L73_07900 [Muribaculaceae bacterium]|nr:hypothetical protein [Muribaculaceae bacterium]